LGRVVYGLIGFELGEVRSRGREFAGFIDSRPELVLIRACRKSPQANGVRERAFGSSKYEYL